MPITISIKKNYRKNLVKKTGINPSNAHAHHDIPQKYRILMAKYGINVDDPQYLRVVAEEYAPEIRQTIQ
jgi:hypothetical protein